MSLMAASPATPNPDHGPLGAPDPVTAWAVRLGASDQDVRGTLELEAEALVFTMTEAALTIALVDIRKAKRTRGSPILVVEHLQDGALARHAFFFAKPPPLKSPEGKSKRKTARKSIMYLQQRNQELKAEVAGWEKAVSAAAKASRG